MTMQLSGTTIENYSSNFLEIGSVLETDEGLEEILGVWETARILSALREMRRDREENRVTRRRR